MNLRGHSAALRSRKLARKDTISVQYTAVALFSLAVDASWRSNRLLSVVVLGFDRLELLLFHGELPERLN